MVPVMSVFLIITSCPRERDSIHICSMIQAHAWPVLQRLAIILSN